MHPLWKPLALVSLGVAALLSGVVIWIAARENPMAARMRRNVEERTRDHLAQGEIRKAAAVLDSADGKLLDPEVANLLRLDVARKSAPEEGEAILDGLQISAMDRVQAGEAAQARLDLQRTLFQRKVLQEGALPAPFEPEAFAGKAAPSAPAAELSRITAKLLALISERRDFARRTGAPADPSLARLESMAVAARYALGEIPYEEVRAGDDETRFLFGDLLFRERQFDRALETWALLSKDPRVTLRKAELSALRRLAPKNLKIWDYDLDRQPGRDPKVESEAVRAVQALFKEARPGVLPVARTGIPKDAATAEPADAPAIFFPEAPELASKAEAALNPDQLYLLVEHRRFEFRVLFDRPFMTRADPVIRLHSAYTGPIEFRLFRVRDLATLSALGPDTLPERRSELEPVRTWQRQYAPLGPNGRDEADWQVQVPSSGPGLFVLMADARYCPVYAFARFIVTDAGLLQQVAADRVLIHSVDRVTGDPVPLLPVEGEVEGHFVLRSSDLTPRDDSNAEEFRRGFQAAWAGKPSEPEAAPGYVRGFESAVRLRAEHPDVTLRFRGTTDPQGLFDWTVAPAWREGYQYSVRTTSTHGGTCTRVESTYSPGAEAGTLVALVYPDRPLYRAGDTVSFKAILRRRTAEGLEGFPDREAMIELGSGARTLFARTLPVTDFGTMSASVDLHAEVPRGLYWARVNNGPPQPLFHVEDYRKPEFEISFSHPQRVRAGEGIDLSVRVNRYSGEPLARTQVSLVIEAAPGAGAASLVDDQGWTAKEGPAWRAMAARLLTTDDDGRCLLHFRTEGGVPSRYVLKAKAWDESAREITAMSAFEASAEPRMALVETDRPVYFPGESARIRFVRSDAAVARIEERAKVDKPFAITVELKDGAGTCDYPVPAAPRDLSVGVRDGDGWTWTPVPLRIKPRASGPALVSLRLDHPTYRIGETAQVEITSSEPSASVLLLEATGRIHRRQVVTLADQKAVVPLEVREEDVPNLHLVAVTVRNDQVGKATLPLEVPPLDRFLTVEVSTDRPEYRPGQECRAAVRVTDSRGRPVPACELSLGVVDDSIYALHADPTPDLREFFHRYSRPLGVEESFFFNESLPPFTVWKAPLFVRGHLGLYETLGVGAGGGGGGRYGGRFGGRDSLVARGGGATAGTVEVLRPRSEFRDTAFWSAHLVTDAQGTARVTFAFPDQLTRFRFTARGITRDHQVGDVRQEAVVRKPFFVRLAVPRLLQEGNTLSVSGLIHNHTDRGQTVHASFRSPFRVVSSTAPAAIAIPAGEFARVEYLLRVDRAVDEAELSFGAECDSGESDLLSVRVPGRHHGSPFQEGRSGSVAGGAPKEEVFRIPPGAIPGTTALRFEFDAGLHTAILAAVDPLIEYPYGCVEQTMSRFLPAVAARRALAQTPARFKEKLPAVIAAGLERLYLLQQPDGGWGWWRGGPRNEPLTAYVLYGLSICKKAGVGVDRGAADRAAKVLEERLSASIQGETAFSSSALPLRVPLDGRVYGLLALAEYDSAWNVSSMAARQLAAAMADRTDRLGDTDVTVLALAAQRLGMTEIAGDLARRVGLHEPSEVTAASFLLQLQAARGGDLAPAIRYLLGRRSGHGWSNTLESAHAILGLAAAVERPSPAMDLPPGRVEIRINGELVQELTLRGAADQAFDGTLTIPAPPAGWGEKAVVRLSFDGQGSAFYTASLEAELGGEDRAPVSSGLEIRREYFERDPDGTGWRLSDGTIRAGSTVFVLLRLETDLPRAYLMVSDPRPDGFEPVDVRTDGVRCRRPKLSGLTDRVQLEHEWPARLDEYRRTARGDPARESAWAKALLGEIIARKKFVPLKESEESSVPELVRPAHLEHRDDRTIFFLDLLPPGSHWIGYVVRAEHPGRLHSLAPRVVGMYEPELHASGAETRLEVVDGSLQRTPAAPLENAAGVDGLLDVLPALGMVDADRLIAMAAGAPRIGDLLLAACGEPAVRAWLLADPATRAAGPALPGRIEAARRDLATRRLCVESLGDAPREWLPALDAALADDRLALRVLQDPTQGEVADSILLWTTEDREWRLALLAAAQKLRGTARVESVEFPTLGISRVLRALGPRAPAGGDLLRWKLAQRACVSGGTLEDLITRCERDLGLRVRRSGILSPALEAGEAPLSRILDRTLLAAGLGYRIEGDAIVIGTLEELLR